MTLNKYRENKWKIILKDDPKEQPIIYNGIKMVFRSKYAMLELFETLKKNRPFEDYDWMEL